MSPQPALRRVTLLALVAVLGTVLMVLVVLGLLPQQPVEPGSGVWSYRGVFCVGVATSFTMSVIAIAGGTTLGLALAVIRRAPAPEWLGVLLRSGLGLFHCVFLSMPAYTLILFAYYWEALNRWPAFWVASAALAVNLSPFVAHIISAGLDNIPQAQIMSARACGYRGWRLYTQFHLSAVRRSVGRPLLVQYYTTMKLTSLASVIGVRELMHSGQTVIRATYETLAVYGLVALGYFLLVTPLVLLSEYMEASDEPK